MSDAENTGAAAIEAFVRTSYSNAAKVPDTGLCCRSSCDSRLLAAIPDVVLERDYGCGNPAGYLRASEKVLDLESGSGKSCFLASQVVGPEGQVIGVDMTDELSNE